MIICVWGHRYLGHCDYFQHEVLGWLCVKLYCFHWMFLPLGPQHVHLSLPGGRAMPVTDVTGAFGRCLMYAWLRSGLFAGAIAALVATAFVTPDAANAAGDRPLTAPALALLLLALLLASLGVGAVVHKPAASLEAQELYREKLQQLLPLTSRPTYCPPEVPMTNTAPAQYHPPKADPEA